MATAMVAPPLFGQAERRVRRVGVAFNSNPTLAKPYLDAFVRGMAEGQYRLDRDYVLDVRYAHGTNDRYPAIMRDLLNAGVEVIVAGGNTSVAAAKEATSIVPIVMAGTNDPDRTGFVETLARPSGNITGVANFTAISQAKRLELLRELLPGASHIVLLIDPKASGFPHGLREAEDAARKWGLRISRADASSGEELEQVLASLPARRPDALLVGNAVLFWTHRKRIVDACARHRIPAIYAYREPVDDGGLISYAASVTETFRRASSYVTRILNGARPADLPVEQPTQLDLVVNLKAAQALGITIPQTLLVRATPENVIR